MSKFTRDRWFWDPISANFRPRGRPKMFWGPRPPTPNGDETRWADHCFGKSIFHDSELTKPFVDFPPPGSAGMCVVVVPKRVMAASLSRQNICPPNVFWAAAFLFSRSAEVAQVLRRKQVLFYFPRSQTPPFWGSSGKRGPS